LGYLEKSPIESFRESENCGEYIEYDCSCKGSYHPVSDHSNFRHLYGKKHAWGILQGELSYHLDRLVGSDLKVFLPDEEFSLFNARFFLGYGINEIRDFLASRQKLFHFSPRPGDIADVLNYPYKFRGELEADSVKESNNENLLGIMRGVSDVLVPLHKRMLEKYKSMIVREPESMMVANLDEVRKSLISNFGEDLRYAEEDLSQRFHSVSEMLKASAQ
jgi:hypothetical protein